MLNRTTLLTTLALILLTAPMAFSDEKTSRSPITGCHQDAQICPDGTVVGRRPPDCEFTPCPEVVEDTGLPGTLTGEIVMGPPCTPTVKEGCAYNPDLGRVLLKKECLPDQIQECPGDPAPATIFIMKKTMIGEATRYDSDLDGKFQIELPAGHYVAKTTCPPQLLSTNQEPPTSHYAVAEVDVKSGEVTDTVIHCYVESRFDRK